MPTSRSSTSTACARQFDDGWGLVRASNTQPALVLRFEASSESRRDQYRALIEEVVADVRAELGG